jgi:hypothetical protein
VNSISGIFRRMYDILCLYHLALIVRKHNSKITKQLLKKAKQKDVNIANDKKFVTIDIIDARNQLGHKRILLWLHPIGPAKAFDTVINAEDKHYLAVNGQLAVLDTKGDNLIYGSHLRLGLVQAWYGPAPDAIKLLFLLMSFLLGLNYHHIVHFISQYI